MLVDDTWPLSCMCPDTNSMDQREEYWGDPILHQDPEDYTSPQHYESGHPQRQPQQQLSHSNYPQHATNILPQHLQHHHHHPRYEQQQHRQHPSRHNATISVADVLCGRGKTSFNHEGNKTFRHAVSAALDDFVNAVNRFEKGIVVQRVVDMVHARGGRFLKEDTRAGTWYQLSEQQSKEKVGHAIRDAANLYEVRKKKEDQMQQMVHQDKTPRLKRSGSDDDNKRAEWWTSSYGGGTDETSVHGSTTGSKGDRSKSYRSSYESTDYSVDYSVTSAAKRRGSMATSQQHTEYQPQRKRRRTASPSQKQSYFHTTMALSDQLLSTPSPQIYSPEDPYALQQHASHEVRRSPITHQLPITASNIVSSSGSQKSMPGGGVRMSSVSSKLRSSPIAPIVPPPASSKQPLSSHQYYHRFTVYDPQQQQLQEQSSSSLLRSTDQHRQFHPETVTDDVYVSPLEATIPHAAQRRAPSRPSSQYSGTSNPYGRSEFVRSLVPPSSYHERHYTPPQYPYGAYPSTASTGILPPMRQFQQHYPQHLPSQGNTQSYVPHTYYQPPQQQQPRGTSTTTSYDLTTANWDTTDERNLQHEQKVDSDDNNNGDGNGTNSDAAVASDHNEP